MKQMPYKITQNNSQDIIQKEFRKRPMHIWEFIIKMAFQINGRMMDQPLKNKIISQSPNKTENIFKYFYNEKKSNGRKYRIFL